MTEKALMYPYEKLSSIYIAKKEKLLWNYVYKMLTRVKGVWGS